MEDDTYEARVQDFDWAIGLNRISLHLMGIWPSGDETKATFWKNIWRTPCMILFMFVFIVVPQMYALVVIGNDLLMIVDNFMTSWPAFTSCVKLYFLWRSKNVLKPVVSSVTEDWLRPKQNWEREAMKIEAGMAKLFTIGGYVLIAISYAGLIIAPLFGINIRLVSNITDYGTRRLLTQSYYPYDYSISPNYELTHISQVFAGTFIAMSLAVPDNYFGALVFHLSAQFEILSVNIVHSIKENDKALQIPENRVFNRRLGLYVNRHVHLLRMVSAVERSFNFLLLIQLSCMCGMACCLGFRILYMLGHNDAKIEIFQILNLVAALFSLMLFTFVNCTASETLATHSVGVFQSIYNSNWYLVPEQSTRDLVILMIMSKHPQSLSAGKILYLSMSSYCTIIKSIAGYVSVLSAVSS